MNILVEALGYQNYGGRWYFRGDTIPVENEADVADMEAMRLAKRIKVPAVEETRGMVAETTPAELPAGEDSKKHAVPAPKRGQYVTRSARTSRQR